MRQIYEFVSEPKGKTYEMLLDHALMTCNTALLVVRDSVRLEASAEKILKKLDKFLKSKVNDSKWPGTKLLYGATATIYRYKYNGNSAEVLKEATERLYGWQQPKLPEDLCLFRPNGSSCLVSIAHEKNGYLELTQEEYKQLLERYREISSLLEGCRSVRKA